MCCGSASGVVVVLVIGAGLFPPILDSLRDIEAGFRREHTVICKFDPSGTL